MTGGPVGWFGKIPALGDFASRRLGPEFLTPWHDWLEASIASSRATLSDDWLRTYLESPVWRFLLAPGVCGPRAWSGVLMPSCDNVGRYFPLTVATALSDALGTPDGQTPDPQWFDQIEAAARATLDLSATLAAFEERLRAIPAIAPARGGVSRTMAPGMHDALQNLIGGSGRSLWWTVDASAQPATVHDVRGLPDGATFVAMLRDDAPGTETAGHS